MSDRDTAEEQAVEDLRAAWQRLADVIHEPKTRHVNVHIFDIGLDCSKCHGSYDGFWEHEDTRVCRDCGDAVLREVMGP